ncbi:acyl-CoA thioesterase [Prauserella shujinwangii]|nr:thioesterase family protein [Prauserella shujinwangii]
MVRMPLRVRYHECDPQGIVFHANYLAYVDMASFELCAALFGSHAAMLERGVDLVVAEAGLRYLAPCRFDDELVVSLGVERVGTTSMVIGIRIHRGEQLVAEGANRYVWVRTVDYRPAPPPEDARELLLRAQPS